MQKAAKTRNPVAGNMHRYNKPQIVKDRKKEQRRMECRRNKELAA
jgi:hypothetical protein